MTPQTLLAALDALGRLVGFIQQQLAKARERGELTLGQEQEFDAKMAEITAQSHWKPNPPQP